MELMPAGERVRELPIEQIHGHIRYLPVQFGKHDQDQVLADSIALFGILSPLVVMEEAPGFYRIVDGHRRYYCASKLGIDSITCSVSPRLSTGDYEVLRFQLHSTHKPLRKWEKQAVFKRLVDLCRAG